MKQLYFKYFYIGYLSKSINPVKMIAECG